MLLTEKDIRTIQYCPKYYHFNGAEESTIETRVLNKLHAKITVLFLKNKTVDVAEIYSSLLSIFNREDLSGCLPADKTNYINKINIAINDSLKEFDIANYIPISGPLLFNKSIGKIAYKFNINGIYKNVKTKTVHFVEFIDGTKHSASADVSIKIKLNAIKKLIPIHHSGRARAYCHVFYFKNNEIQRSIVSSEEIKEENYSVYSHIIQNESYFPVLPCYRNCKYKKKCK